MSKYDSYGELDSPFDRAGDRFFQRVNARMRPDQLAEGEVAMSVNGRMEIDGAWQPRQGVNAFGSVLSASGTPINFPFYTYSNVAISSASRTGTTVTIILTTTGAFVNGTVVGVAGLVGTVNPNGNRLLTGVSGTTLTYELTGATGNETYTLTGGSSDFVGAPFTLPDLSRIYGYCLFSDPLSGGVEHTILARGESAVAVNMVTRAQVTIAYPTNETITSGAEMLQAFTYVFIFREGETTLVWDGVLTGTPAFVKVANGDYTQPTVFTSAGNAAATNGLVTISETAHGLSIGNRVTIFDQDGTKLGDGEEYIVSSVPNANSFTFYADTDDFGPKSIVLGLRQSSGRGYTHMPAPAWGVYHQRRLIVPFAYTTSGTSGSETITARNVHDELLFSDIFDGDTYDQLQNQFKVTAGIADSLQWVHPFTEDAAIAFNRNSIHLIQGISGSLNDITIQEITREAGLVARRSVVTIGSQVFFLSDNGIYATQFGDLYNLRGAGIPLSEAIQPVIKRINKDYAENAVATFFDNRYRIAVPLDGSAVNNAILVFNVLNQAWESVDIINDPNWDVTGFVVTGAAAIRKLFAVNRFGGLHEIDSRSDDVDVLFLFPGIEPSSQHVESYVTTRQYSLGVMERKKFNSYEFHLESSDTNVSDATIEAETENTDATTDLGTLAGILGEELPVSEDASIRGRIGNLRAYGLQFTLTPTIGRPKLRMAKVEATTTFRSTTQAT